MTLSDFDLHYELGRGAFGRVYFATSPKTGKEYAIKTIRKDTILDNQMIEITNLEKNI